MGSKSEETDERVPGDDTPSTSGKTVLLAEDDPDIRESYRIWLSEGHWEVREAVNGLEALDQLDRTVDILVLDRRLPRISGPEIVNRLSETSFDGEIIVISAYSPDGYLDECDVTRYITKPIMRDEFLRELRQTV